MECVHHWLVPTPNGPQLPSRCRDCGEERIFDVTPEVTVGSRPQIIVSRETRAKVRWDV